MITISIANCKGGVGKTIVAANLAWELARLGHLTLMVDLDPQCDLSKVYRRARTFYETRTNSRVRRWNSAAPSHLLKKQITM